MFKIQRVENIPLAYTNLFRGMLIITVCPHQQTIDVYLEDHYSEKLIKIASIIDKNMSLHKCRMNAIDLLNNEDFCFAHYRDLLNKEENEI